MYGSLISGAAVLLALAPGALSIGMAKVYNNCSFPVYFASIAQNSVNPMLEVPVLGFSEPYILPNVGISIKLATTATGPVSQFEYTWASPMINYDISNINGNPFWEHGMVLTPSTPEDPAYPTCKVVNCPAGQAYCEDAYNQPDDVRTMVCGEDTDLIMTICPSTLPSSHTMEKRNVHRHHARHLPKLW